LAIALVFGCGDDPPETATTEEDLGPIDSVIDEVSRTIWPGNVRANGQRYVRLLNGFFEGEPSAYWFAGFASRQTADVFWFCRDGDTECPFDSTGTIDRSRTVGDPVFARLLGERGYSPFWLVWVVRVPDDYKPNDLKSVHGIRTAAKDGRVEVDPLTWDHGGDVGPGSAIMHCLLVLDGTVLERNGEPIVGSPDVPSKLIELQTGWHKQYRVQFFDFTISAGLFAPDPASESVPLMPSADIFVFFRECDLGSTTPPCQAMGNGGGMTGGEDGAVSERGVEVDLTADGDKADNNNIISGFPRTPSPSAHDRLYSPLWKVNKVRIKPAHDMDLQLIDLTSDQDATMVKDTASIRDLVDRGLVHEPEFLHEDAAADKTPANDGIVFFNCPSQVSDQ